MAAALWYARLVAEETIPWLAVWAAFTMAVAWACARAMSCTPAGVVAACAGGGFCVATLFELENWPATKFPALTTPTTANSRTIAMPARTRLEKVLFLLTCSISRIGVRPTIPSFLTC
jgi:hypothetical protein